MTVIETGWNSRIDLGSIIVLYTIYVNSTVTTCVLSGMVSAAAAEMVVGADVIDVSCAVRILYIYLSRTC